MDTAYRPCPNLWDGLKKSEAFGCSAGHPLPLPGCLPSLSTEAMSFLPNARWVHTQQHLYKCCVSRGNISPLWESTFSIWVCAVGYVWNPGRLFGVSQHNCLTEERSVAPSYAKEMSPFIYLFTYLFCKAAPKPLTHGTWERDQVFAYTSS